MRKFFEEKWDIFLVVVLSVFMIVMITIGLLAHPVDHMLHNYSLHLINGEVLEVEYENCHIQIRRSGLYAVCGCMDWWGDAKESFVALITYMEEMK